MKKTTQEAEQPNRKSKEQLIFFCLLFAGADQSWRELTVKLTNQTSKQVRVAQCKRQARETSIA